MVRQSLFVLLLASLAACAPPPEAPSDLGDLSLFLFAQYETGEDVVADGLVTLNDVLLGLDGVDWDAFEVTDPRDGREWSPPLLEGDDLHDVDVPGDPRDQLPVAVASVSDYRVADHAALVALADQTPIETESSVAYDREFLSDVACFVDGTCDRVDTHDSIHRQNIVVDLWYEVTKSYVWVDLPDDRGRAMTARSWAPTTFSDGGDTIQQSYNIAVWLPHPRGSLRYQCLWSSWDIPEIDNDTLVINTTAEGMDERYVLTEEYLAAQ